MGDSTSIIPAEFAEFCRPAVLADGDNFLIKIAESTAEIAEAMQLRYNIFKSEQGRLTTISKIDDEQGIDMDDFDSNCIHLIVRAKDNGRIVGTYRVHPGVVAMRNDGFYSSTEYKIENIESLAANTLEYGRSCVDPEYRNGAVVGLLWHGIGELHKRCGMRYLLGCVSLESVDPVVGWAVYKHAKKMTADGADCPVNGKPLPKYVLPHPGDRRVEEFIADADKVQEFMPRLLKGYLRLGAFLAGEPVLDIDFGAIDMLIFLDLENIPARYRKHYLGL